MAGFQNKIMFANGDKIEPSSSRDIDEMQQVNTDVARINYTGNPEGVVNANPSSLCHDPVSGNIYVKQTGTGNTGWKLIANTSEIPSFPLSLANGGTNASLTASNNGIFYSTASAGAILPTANSALLNTDSSGVPSLNSSPTISGTFTAANVTVTGVLNLPTTIGANNGVLNLGGNSFLHSYGTGDNNTFIGTIAGNFTLDTATSSNNTGIGYSSLRSLTANAVQNVGAGNFSLGSLTTGYSNTCTGYQSLYYLLTGSQNCSFGHGSGLNYTGAESNNINIGYNVFGTTGESNVTRIGNGQTKCIIDGIAGASVSNAKSVVIDSLTGQLGVTNGLIILKSAQVDMTSATAQLLFSTSSSPFVITEIVEFANNIDTKTVDGSFNLGWSSTAYDDLYTGSDILASTNTALNIVSFQDGSSNQSGVIPASTDVYVNVLSPSTAVKDLQTFYFLGFYLF